MPSKPKPDDILTPEESALVKKAEREMRQGKFVTLAQLRHDLELQYVLSLRRPQ
jgi:hypothetical protein